MQTQSKTSWASLKLVTSMTLFRWIRVLPFTSKMITFWMDLTLSLSLKTLGRWKLTTSITISKSTKLKILTLSNTKWKKFWKISSKFQRKILLSSLKFWILEPTWDRLLKLKRTYTINSNLIKCYHLFSAWIKRMKWTTISRRYFWMCLKSIRK